MRRADFFRARNYVAARVLDGLGALLARGSGAEGDGLRAPVLRILCLIIDRLGDVLMVTPAFRAIRDMYPAARLTVVVPSGAKDLVSSRPEVDEVICFDPPWLVRAGAGGRGIGRVALQVLDLRRKRFDLSISFHPHPWGHLIQKAVGAGRRIAPAYKGCGWLLTDAVDTSPHVHILKRLEVVLRSVGWIGPLGTPGLTVSREEEGCAREFLASHRFAGRLPPIALAPGGRDPAKRWPLGSWVELAKGIGAREDRRPVVLVGGAEDREMCQRINSATGGCLVDASGLFTLRETAAVLKLCQVVVTVDSLARHLAAAVGTPVIVLQWAGERPETWDAYGEQDWVVRKPVPCSPCGRVICPRPTHECMEAITPEEVLGFLAGARMSAVALPIHQ